MGARYARAAGCFVDHLLVAIRRGTTSAEARQGHDVYVSEANERPLLDSDGRNVIATMVPVVVLVVRGVALA